MRTRASRRKSVGLAKLSMDFLYARARPNANPKGHFPGAA